MFVSIDTDALSTWAFNITDKVTLTVYDIYKIPFVENKEVMIYIIDNRIILNICTSIVREIVASVLKSQISRSIHHNDCFPSIVSDTTISIAILSQIEQILIINRKQRFTLIAILNYPSFCYS